jgi:hypothetical protein
MLINTAACFTGAVIPVKIDPKKKLNITFDLSRFLY